MRKNLKLLILSALVSLTFALPQTTIGMDEKDKDNIGTFVMGGLLGELENISHYDVDKEYGLHQEVSERFFRRITRKKEAREVTETFKQQLRSKTPQTQIRLDGFSSRTRILLFRELTAFSCAHNIFSIPFIFHMKEFKIDLTPSLRQPGCGIVTTIGDYNEIYGILHKLTPEYQKIIAEKIKNLRKKRVPYHPSSPNLQISLLHGEVLDLEILNILLDFEVARRLQWCEEGEMKSWFVREMKHWEEYVGNSGKEGESARSEEKNKKAERVLVAQQPFYDFICTSEESYKKNLKKESRYEEYKIEYMESDRFYLDAVPVASAIVGALKLSSGVGEACELLMMEKLPENKIPLKEKIYLEEEDCKIKYVFIGPKNTPVEGSISLDLDDRTKIYENDKKLYFCIKSDRYKKSRTFSKFSEQALNIHKHTILKKLKQSLTEVYMDFEVFFHAPEDDSIGQWGEDYYCGEFSAFEGRPDGGARKRAIKNILEKTNPGKNSTKEDIHQEFLEFFGGSSESEGDEYS